MLEPWHSKLWCCWYHCWLLNHSFVCTDMCFASIQKVCYHIICELYLRITNIEKVREDHRKTRLITIFWRGERGQTDAVNWLVLRPSCLYRYCIQSVCEKQVWNRGVKSAEDADITVWIILYISPHEYVLLLKIKTLLSNSFGWETLGKGVLWTWYWTGSLRSNHVIKLVLSELSTAV